MQPTYQHAPYGSALYAQSLALREAVLRAPLGMKNRPEDTASDAEQLHFVATAGDTVIATVSMAMLDAARAKIRQMAVHPDHHGQGIGAGLMRYAHREAMARGYTHITLNARDTAVRFYSTLGYETVGDVFEEIGITHQRMDSTLR